VRLPGNNQLRRNRTYTLATSDFLALGGAGFDMLAGVREVEQLSLFAVDALANYLRRLPQPVTMTSVTRFRVDR
jgi:2',3'-cyclic-nucleotide 2'-phosphodiesterase (5'-nucleotidase family)